MQSILKLIGFPALILSIGLINLAIKKNKAAQKQLKLASALAAFLVIYDLLWDGFTK
ncbi:hypothetical protein JCM14202_1233 [Agrilactobacillus composti DSM 18527 = JCM 14202]|nr:hypothetical protein [Agrilactobacillus composti]GAF39372.1 hypothetical protein JCM14202_1233 [Agrilactobacillus composti DSM 18527 = JCM 14202]